MRAVAYLLALWALLPSGVRGQAPPAPLTAGQPDVLILVFATPDGQDQMGFTYPRVVPHAQALRDLRALEAAGGWTARNVKVTDALPPVRGSKQKMTSLECVAPHLVRPELRGFSISPFVQAFRGYPHLVLTFFTPGNFPFAGLRQYSDKNMSLSLDQHGSTYTYQILIRNSNFGKLALPLAQPETRSADQAGSGRRRIGAWMIGIVAALAVGTGCVVYAVMARNTETK